MLKNVGHWENSDERSFVNQVWYKLELEGEESYGNSS